MSAIKDSDDAVSHRGDVTPDRRIEILTSTVESLLKAIESLAGAPPKIADDPEKRAAQVWAKAARRELRELDT